MSSPWTFTEPLAVFVEGTSDQKVIARLAKIENLSDIQVVCMNGKDDWIKSIGVFKGTRGFQRVKTLGLVRDADDNPTGAFGSLQGVLKEAGFPVPNAGAVITEKDGLKSGAFVMPDNLREGELEDLCNEAVRDHARVPCVSQYFECVEALDAPSTQLAKGRIAAFIAGSNEPWDRVGEAFDRGIIPQDSEVFLPLRKFLSDLAKA
ncbi:MAG TPA: DUF3226 domain-containing protein [Acidimicrobiales bacterium]